jgi:phosphate:Na+ symporter
MDASTIFTTILAFVLVFLFAIQKFSRQIQMQSGEHLKTFLAKWSSNPLKGAASGAFVTALIQSSTASTVILVGLVNAGVIPVTNALSVVIGANIGASVTAQLFALKMTYIAPIIVILGFIVAHTHSKLRRYGKAIFYFGIIFLSLFTIGILVEPLRNHPSFINLIQSVSNPFAAIIAGAVITVILQSSSVLTGLVLILASSGLIALPTAVGFLFGSALGSPITPIIASASANTDAKKVAVAHGLFNYIGVVFFLTLLPLFTMLLKFISNDPVQQIVNAHFIFNATCALFALVFFSQYEKLVRVTTTVLYKK